jgi:hypothetical protein
MIWSIYRLRVEGNWGVFRNYTQGWGLRAAALQSRNSNPFCSRPTTFASAAADVGLKIKHRAKQSKSSANAISHAVFWRFLLTKTILGEKNFTASSGLIERVAYIHWRLRILCSERLGIGN